VISFSSGRAGGAVVAKVRSDRDVPENMVFTPFCHAEPAANPLTNPALDRFGKISRIQVLRGAGRERRFYNAVE
jgi:hypothetical protein